MKNYINYIIMFISIAVLSTSCEDLSTTDLGLDSQWIQFENDSNQILENAPEPLQIPIIYAAETNSSDIQVNFSYFSSQPDGFSIEPADGIVTIPAGEFVGYITVTPINDLIAGEDITIDFSIEDNTGLNIGTAGEGVYNTIFSATIIEDDCPIDLDLWVGTYKVEEKFTAGTNAPLGLSDFFSEIYQVELAKDPNDITGTKVLITNSAGYNTYFNDGTVMSFITCSKEVLFDDGFPLLALFRNFEYESSVFSTDTFSITCSGPLATFGPYEFVLTKI